MNLNLRGRRVLITGASKGIGAAVAGVFAGEGCDLVLAGRDKQRLDELAESLRSVHGVDVQTVPGDLSKSDDLAKLAASSLDIDVLVNNAGDIPGGTLQSIDMATWQAAWQLKVFGYIALTQRLYEQMKRRGGGVIINNIGAYGERPDSNYIAGSSGNAALMAFSKALGGRSLADNIRVVGVNPGPVETERIVRLMRSVAQARFGDEERYLELTATFPRGRAATPREIADTIVFLSSDRSAYTSGTVVTVDGGLSNGSM